MKKGDYVVILFIVLLAVSVFGITHRKIENNGKLYAVIKVDGKEIARYEMGVKKEIHHIDSKYGHNEIEIYDNSVKISESNCRDKICIHMGSINRQGQSIICLPNRLIVTIEGEENEVDVVLH